MNSITKEYLTGIIFKKISETIDKRRESRKHQFDNEPYPGATDEEVLDFIISIPYFDAKLKDFLLGNLLEDTIIISQSWENEFIKNTVLWAGNFEWLFGNDYFLNDSHNKKTDNENAFLTLPY
ncbi:MAG: hypothetical protein JWP81_2151 [Ferruginibacter sp.]|nr:hypothetical protein [Ferruginibacter sp.]